MLTRVVLDLTCKAEVKAQERSFTGFLVRGLVYEVLKSLNADYADKLHSGRWVKYAPFSVTPPYTLEGGAIKVLNRRAPAGARFFIEVRGLEDEFSRRFLEGLVKGFEVLRLGKDGVASVNTVSVSSTSFNELAKAEDVGADSFLVSFITPTFFRKDVLTANVNPKLKSLVKEARHYLLPDPVSLFSNLHNLYCAFSRDKPPSSYRDWLSAYGLIVSEHAIKTIRVYEHPKRGLFVRGFVGRVKFDFLKDVYDKEAARWTWILLRFAKYSNVGGGRTAGLGVVDFKPILKEGEN